ncbi:uncharacterized protein [Eurosta solidaginis]|uniref:uncharacterized protein n=1 Tax=Eurosta solidaginis TaxID=178769 RepID=UPI0035311DAA
MSDEEQLAAAKATELPSATLQNRNTAASTTLAASTGINASTGAPASATGSAPPEAHISTEAHVSTVDNLQPGSSQQVTASTPRVSTGNTIPSFMPNQNLNNPDMSPLRTRSGILRLAPPQKRPRIPRAVSNNANKERGPQVTWAPPAPTTDNRAQNLSAQFSTLDIENNIFSSASRGTQGAPRNFSAPCSSTSFRFGANFQPATQNYSVAHSQVSDCRDTAQHANLFATMGTQINPTTFGNHILQNNVASSNTTFSNVSVPHLMPSAAITQGHLSHHFTPTRVPNALPNNNFGSYTAPTTSFNVANTTFPFSRNSLEDINLSTSHVAARQVMSKDLPTFSGNPEEWPLFITNFEQSTIRCGFTDQENLIRLQKCLKGSALDAVRGKLMMPSTISYAIETLRMLYGRPDVIHQTLQKKLRQQPVVKTENLNTLVNFALAVQNYRATMQAIGLEDYLNDPMLLNDLISRLPCDLRLDWGKHRMFHARVDIALFDEWLFNLATCASQVTPIEHSNASLYASEERKGRRKTSRERVMLHDFRRSEVENCPRCSKTHTLSDCGEFKAMSIDMRWKFIRENKLCIRCFKRHFVRRCNSKRKCTVDGCKMPHNILLHSPHGNISSLQVSEPKDNLSRNQTVLFHAKEKKCAIFRYIAVTLQGKLGSIDTYAFIDEGSACTLIEDELASQLGLDGPKEELCLQWTGEVTQNEANSKSVALHISARSPTS